MDSGEAWTVDIQPCTDLMDIRRIRGPAMVEC